MNKRIQIILTPEASCLLNKLHKEVKEGFKLGTIKLSDLVSEIILQSKIDIKEVRSKHTDLKKSLLELARTDEVDLDTILKILSELKGKNTKKIIKNTSPSTEVKA